MKNILKQKLLCQVYMKSSLYFSMEMISLKCQRSLAESVFDMKKETHKLFVFFIRNDGQLNPIYVRYIRTHTRFKDSLGYYFLHTKNKLK